MEILLIDGIYFKPEVISKQLHFSDLEALSQLVKKAMNVMEPKAAFEIGYVEKRGDDSVVIKGLNFHSRGLCQNLNGVGRVFPYVLTLGPAFDELIDNAEDLLDQYLFDQIGNITLRKARQKFKHHLQNRFAHKKLSFMSPGSLEDWPIEEQKQLFLLIGPVESEIRVQLTDSFIMVPRKSLSGIYFPSEVSFLSCQLCPRESCDSRKAKFDKNKAIDYGLI
jgi:hypothetical protein